VIVSSSDEGDLLGHVHARPRPASRRHRDELTGDEITEPNLLHAMEGSRLT